MDWKHKFIDISGCGSASCSEHGTAVQLKFIQTEIIEKLIEDIPDYPVNTLPNFYKGNTLKQQLRAKWLP